VYFDNLGNAKPNFYSQAVSKGINFISEMSTVYSFTQKDAYRSKGNIKMPKLENIKYSYDVVEGNATINLYSIKMSALGTVYAIAREFIKIVPDPENEFGTKDIQTRIPETPSVGQIYACKDWNDEP